MDQTYLQYERIKLGPKARFFKVAQQKKHALMRERTVAEHRAAEHKLFHMLPLPLDVTVRPAEVGGVPCEWITRADSSPNRVIVYLHGGSWMFGDLDTARPTGVMLCEMTNCTVLVADYRLAPEHPYPAGLQDCLSLYRQLLLSGFVANCIGVFGDSAGGNLSLCLPLLLRKEGLPMPAAIACASPVTDLRPGSDMRSSKEDILFTQYEGKEQDIFSLYLAGQDPETPTASPVLGDLSGYPPILIHVGEDESLCRDNIAFAKKARSQGVEIVCKIWEEMFHDFTILGVTLKQGKESMEEIACHLERYLGQAQLD